MSNLGLRSTTVTGYRKNAGNLTALPGTRASVNETRHRSALDTGREKKEWQINVNDLREQSEAQGKKKKNNLLNYF